MAASGQAFALSSRQLHKSLNLQIFMELWFSSGVEAPVSDKASDTPK